MSQTTLSFRGREHSDRRHAPSEHKLRERSPESITTARPVATGERATAGWGYGFRARRQVGETDLPTPRNDSVVCDAVPLAGLPAYRRWVARPRGGLRLRHNSPTLMRELQHTTEVIDDLIDDPSGRTFRGRNPLSHGSI